MTSIQNVKFINFKVLKCLSPLFVLDFLNKILGVPFSAIVYAIYTFTDKKT